jgi:hypothetical protein
MIDKILFKGRLHIVLCLRNRSGCSTDADAKIGLLRRARLQRVREGSANPALRNARRTDTR